jgi:acetyl esterase
VALDPRLEMVLELFLAEPKQDRTLGAQARRDALAARRAERTFTVVDEGDFAVDETDHLVAGPHGDVPVRVFRPRDGELPGLLYIHGGGWWLGDIDDSAPGCRRRAAATDAVVISIGYRLAPEHPFPQGLDDCWAATQWVFDNAGELGIDAGRIAISGSSAGGNLAAAVTLLARDAGGPSICAQLLEAPGMNLAFDDASSEEHAEMFPFTREDLEECVRFYIGDGDPRQPLVSPLFADLHDLPPALVTTAECDPVRDGGEAYAAKLAAAGVPVVSRRFDGIPHGGFELEPLRPAETADYRALVYGFLRDAFSRAPA